MEFPLRARPIKVEKPQDNPQHAVRLGQRVIPLESLSRRQFRFDKSLLRVAETPEGAEETKLRDSRVGQRVVWIGRNSLLEILLTLNE